MDAPATYARLPSPAPPVSDLLLLPLLPPQRCLVVIASAAFLDLLPATLEQYEMLLLWKRLRYMTMASGRIWPPQQQEGSHLLGGHRVELYGCFDSTLDKLVVVEPICYDPASNSREHEEDLNDWDYDDDEPHQHSNVSIVRALLPAFDSPAVHNDTTGGGTAASLSHAAASCQPAAPHTFSRSHAAMGAGRRISGPVVLATTVAGLRSSGVSEPVAHAHTVSCI